jgi:hypothetical protein
VHFQELPDTLDVHIAQREFETTMEIIKVSVSSGDKYKHKLKNAFHEEVN